MSTTTTAAIHITMDIMVWFVAQLSKWPIGFGP
jgi:hypothetical protein